MQKCEYCQRVIGQALISGATIIFPRLVGGKWACHECADRLIAEAKAVQYPINGHCPRCGAPVYGPSEAPAFAPSYTSGDGYYPMNLVSYGCSCRFSPVVNYVKLDDRQMEQLKDHLMQIQPKPPEPKKGWFA